jgi:hypothetical protein
MKKIALLIFPVIFLLSTCALEIANVIGPGGGYVYYDKGNYKDGWRYKECSPYDICELTDTGAESMVRAVNKCKEQSDEWYAHDWEIPDESDLKKILECFSYGLTKFSPDYYYLSLSVDQPSTCDVNDPSTWKVVILHKASSKQNLNGKVEKVEKVPETLTIRVRPVRKF